MNDQIYYFQIKLDVDYIMIGVTSVKESNNANLLNLYSRNSNDYIGFGTFSGKIYGDPQLIQNHFKISRGTISYLYFVYNGFNKRLIIFEKDKFDN